jgi:Gpi18-like mannosyltransferase
MKKLQSFSFVMGILVIWGLLLVTVVIYGISHYTFAPTYSSPELLTKYGSRLLTTWAQFDGVHYLTIAEQGYKGTALIQAFFPLYPLLIRVLSFGIFNKLVVGLAISLASLCVALLLFYKLISLDEKRIIARKSILLLLCFPTSFYFGAVYTESLFFLLVIACFYFARKGKWWLAGILGALASANRLVGVFLIPALLVEYWLQNRKIISWQLFWCVLPVSGLLLYMTYLANQFGDPLLFYHVQNSFGASRSSDKLVLLYQVFYRYIKMFLTVSVKNPIYFIMIQEFISGLIGMVGLSLGWFRIRRSYVVFGLFAFILPTLTGTLSSMTRYLLPIFPLYIVAATFLPQKVFYFIIFISTILLITNMLLFTQGLWVA